MGDDRLGSVRETSSMTASDQVIDILWMAEVKQSTRSSPTGNGST